MNKQDLLASVYRKPMLPMIEKHIVGAFVAWTAEALSSCPVTPGAKVVIDSLIQYQFRSYSIKHDAETLDSFLRWVEEAKEGCAAGYEVGIIQLTFDEYRKALRGHKDRVKQEVANYWQQ
jgi:hypothetical protein